MINRDLIRLKIVQLTYAYQLDGSPTVDNAEKELAYSLGKAYDLYNYMLCLIVEVSRMAARKVDTLQARFERLQDGEAPNTKFINNRFALQLESNLMLKEFCEQKKWSWMNKEEVVRSLYEEILASDDYKAYMSQPSNGYEEDRELWRRLYKSLFMNNEMIEETLEDISLYWNDDKTIVDSFVLKTIKQFNEDEGENQALLPEFKYEEDKEFANKLLRAIIMNAPYYTQLQRENTRGWNLERTALMDRVIIHVALAEILTFPTIPIRVSINEYVELSKYYSAPRSAHYINGMLDNICKRLIKEKKLIKKEEA